MEFFQEIALSVLEILTLVFGILGLTFSVLLLFSPNLAKNVSNLFNRQVNFDKKMKYLDKDIKIDTLVYKHHVLVGTGLILGSFFSLIFFFFNMDFSAVAHILFASQKNTLHKVIVLQSVLWVAKIACLLGLVCGVFLVFIPKRMQNFESKLNVWLATQPLIDKLNDSKRDLDPILFRNVFIFGLTGAIISSALVILSVINLLN